MRIKIRYQYRLTQKLHQLHKQEQRKLFTHSTLTALFSIIGAQVSSDFSSALELFRNEVIHINGNTCVNPSIHLFVNDFVQLIISLKFYFLAR